MVRPLSLVAALSPMGSRSSRRGGPVSRNLEAPSADANDLPPLLLLSHRVRGNLPRCAPETTQLSGRSSAKKERERSRLVFLCINSMPAATPSPEDGYSEDVLRRGDVWQGGRPGCE